jgi:hypothetical protein
MNFPYPARVQIILERLIELLANASSYDGVVLAELILEQAQALLEASENATFDREYQYRQAGRAPKALL